MGKKKSTHLGVWLVAVILAATGYIAFIHAYKDGITITENNDKDNGTITYESIEDMQKAVGFNVEVPIYVADSTEDTKITVFHNQIVTISGETFAFKASPLVDVDADVLGLYEDSDIDYKYTVKDSDIVYYRYRQQYKEYPSCTILNWVSNDVMYGLMVEKDISETIAEIMLGIDGKTLEVYSNVASGSENVDFSDNEYNFELVRGTISMSLPSFSGKIKVDDFDSYAVVYSGDTMLFMVSFEGTDVVEDATVNIEDIHIREGVDILYYGENMYDHDTDAYNDYDIMLSTIYDISKTIKIKKN